MPCTLLWPAGRGAGRLQGRAQVPGPQPTELPNRPADPRVYPDNQMATGCGRERSPAQAEPTDGCPPGRLIRNRFGPGLRVWAGAGRSAKLEVYME